MKGSGELKSLWIVLVAVVAAVVLPAASAVAEGTRIADQIPERPDLRAARLADDFVAKISPARGYKGKLFIGRQARRPLDRTPETDITGSVQSNADGARQNFYPDDMGYFGGPTVQSAQQINVFWGEADGSTWGNPQIYEAALNQSTMVEVLNQYTFQPRGAGHWPVAAYWWYGASVPPLVFDSQIAGHVQMWATADRRKHNQQLNYGAIYHVFLPPGTDVCFDNVADGCYNPDGRARGQFAFCGYHSVTNLDDGTVVLYTVEPYQQVNGCQASPDLSDNTANVLGHEIAETISDPIPGTGWVVKWAADSGSEIADVCAWTIVRQELNGLTYNTQNWYSNRYHACANAF